MLYGCLAKLEQAGLVKLARRGPSSSLSHHRLGVASGEGKAHRVRRIAKLGLGRVVARCHEQLAFSFTSGVLPKGLAGAFGDEVGMSAEFWNGETTRTPALELARSVLGAGRSSIEAVSLWCCVGVRVSSLSW